MRRLITVLILVGLMPILSDCANAVASSDLPLV
jgi:hypothetical protein